MTNFATEHSRLIDEYCDNMLNIERAVFINCSGLPNKQKSILYTYSIAMLYSIWEGFVSRSFRLYINYINDEEISYDRLISSIVVYNMELRFKQFKNYPIDERKKFTFFASLQKHYQKKLEIIPLVDTENNVGYKVLNKLMKTFGLKAFPKHWKYYTYPNSNLEEMMDDFLRYRNSISHGGDISSEEVVTQLVFSKYRVLIRDLMYGMHDAFLFGIDQRSFETKIS